MEGFFGDILKTLVAVMLAFALLTILIFFYHLQALTHYQHDVNSILEKNAKTIPFKGQFNSNNRPRSIASKLYNLDNQYNWVFTIQPNSNDPQNSRYNYGDHESYTVEAHIPLSFDKFTSGDYPQKNQNFDRNNSKFIYSTHINGQATCELDKDADINQQ